MQLLCLCTQAVGCHTVLWAAARLTPASHNAFSRASSVHVAHLLSLLQSAYYTYLTPPLMSVTVSVGSHMFVLCCCASYPLPPHHRPQRCCCAPGVCAQLPVQWDAGAGQPAHPAGTAHDLQVHRQLEEDLWKSVLWLWLGVLRCNASVGQGVGGPLRQCVCVLCSCGSCRSNLVTMLQTAKGTECIGEHDVAVVHIAVAYSQ